MTGSARFEIVAGGEPKPEQLAALGLALDDLATSAANEVGRPVSGWQRAGLLESTGHPQVAERAKLR